MQFFTGSGRMFGLQAHWQVSRLYSRTKFGSLTGSVLVVFDPKIQGLLWSISGVGCNVTGRLCRCRAFCHVWKVVVRVCCGDLRVICQTRRDLTVSFCVWFLVPHHGQTKKHVDRKRRFRDDRPASAFRKAKNFGFPTPPPQATRRVL